MISVPPTLSTSPPPFNPRQASSPDISSFSPPLSPVAPATVLLSPNPSPPNSPDSPHQSLAGNSVPSSPPLATDVLRTCPRFPQDIAESAPPPMTEGALEIYVDDEGLSSIEKIYLFCRSKATVHRVFISRSLHTFLPSITPLEGVEYVLPLLNGLAMDDEDVVKEALVTNLVATMWWFFENCRLVEDEPSEEHEDPPLLPVQTFTPVLGSLLIDHNTMVGGPARFAVVEILNRLHAADERGEDRPPFGRKERRMLEQEVVHQVIIGMGRLDVTEENFPSPVSRPELTPVHSSTVLPPPSTEVGPLVFPPASLLISQPVSSSTGEIAPAHSMQHAPTPVTTLCVPALSPSTLPSPDQQWHTLPVSALPPPLEVTLGNWVPSSPHSTSEATFGDSSLVETGSEEDGWLTAEGRNSQGTQEDTNEQAAIGRLSSMSLIATVTAHVKLPEDTIRAFADEVAYIGGDPLYWVRREASFAVGALAKVVPTEVVFLSLLPLFEALARDPVWHVRHSAVFALPGILTRLTPRHRRTLALDTLLLLASDVAPTVRSGVLEVLGEVIYAFHQDEGGAPEELVGLFVGRGEDVDHRVLKNSSEHWLKELTTTRVRKSSGALLSVFENDEDAPEGGEVIQPATPSTLGTSPAVMSMLGGFFHDPARPLITSFNYPAVALSLGPQRWSEVRGYYLALTRDANVRVRRTVAAGLGEMARILGSALAERDLVDVWQDMVHDVEDGQTRLKALGGICLFVGALEGAIRDGVLSGLVELWERWLTGWRERECLTKSLPALARLAEGQSEVVRTLMSKALVDNVAAVREAAIGALTRVIRAFEIRPHLVEGLRDDLQGLACADSCRRRATYVACYRALAEDEGGQGEVVRDEFWKHIIQLSQDNVVDVRIGVARLLGVVCDKIYHQPSSRSPHLTETIRRLGQDTSRDVRAFVAFLLAPVDPAQSQLNPVPAATAPVTFAIFSRPPPKAPSLGIVLEEKRDLGMERHFPIESSIREDGTLGVLARADPGKDPSLVSWCKENEELDRGETVPTEGPFKPPPLQKVRSDSSDLH